MYGFLFIDINYFHCVQIIGLLKQCGEGSTNFFGQYSSKRMKVGFINILLVQYFLSNGQVFQLSSM